MLFCFSFVLLPFLKDATPQAAGGGIVLLYIDTRYGTGMPTAIGKMPPAPAFLSLQTSPALNQAAPRRQTHGCKEYCSCFGLVLDDNRFTCSTIVAGHMECARLQGRVLLLFVRSHLRDRQPPQSSHIPHRRVVGGRQLRLGGPHGSLPGSQRTDSL